MLALSFFLNVFVCISVYCNNNLWQHSDIGRYKYSLPCSGLIPDMIHASFFMSV